MLPFDLFARRYIESGAHGGKGSDTHKAAVTGDTVKLLLFVDKVLLFMH
jgi:hypothetical protein